MSNSKLVCYTKLSPYTYGKRKMCIRDRDSNNAKYWCESAQAIAGGGVTSFNGRGGIVKPKKGDYTAEMVGADASGAAAAVQSNLGKRGKRPEENAK